MKKTLHDMIFDSLRCSRQAVVCLCVMLMFAVSASGAALTMSKELSWRNISIAGSQLSVFSIHSDKDGILWLGTNSGLFFYDGATLRSLSKELSGSQIFAIIES
ncbi:MAG: hypothetical protein HUK12_01415, partial [Muribaculaceae bacterium]|nr:hypothetical protein [Muribaculaceae bacterium]